MRKLLPLSYLFFLVAFIACTEKNSTEDATYFGGKIINPKNNYVLLFKDEVLIDSIQLDENDRFLYQFKNFSPGLYNFNHEEYQYVFIEPQDSIIFRVNTIGFDESLTFTGRGSDKNNFIINTFLANERHEEKSRELYKLPAEKFSNRVDAELKQRLNMLEMYKERYNFSADFNIVAEAHTKFYFYTLKEHYPKYNKEQADSINRTIFYDYRNSIDFNTESLNSFYPYYKYMYALIDNLANSKDIALSNPENLVTVYKNKNAIIDSLVTHKGIKNKLLKNSTLHYLSKASNKTDAQKILANYTKYNTCNNNEERINKLVENIDKLSKGNVLPDFNVITLNKETIAFKKLVQKPTVVYFWTNRNPFHLKSVHKKANIYASETNNYNFIGISLDADETAWRDYATRSNFTNSYLFETPKNTKEDLLIQNISKIYVLDKNGKILSTDLNIFDQQFMTKLQQLK